MLLYWFIISGLLSSYHSHFPVFINLRSSLQALSCTQRIKKENVPSDKMATVNDSLFAPGTRPKLISNRFAFTEGPAADKRGNVYFTDQPNDRIWKYSTNGKLSVFMTKTGRSNGLYIDRRGHMLACADEKNEIWRISPQKKVTVLISQVNGQRLNGPNDLWEHPRGGIYFTDPYYQRPYWERKEPEIKEEKVYYLPAGKKEALMADDQLVKPNGIIGSGDGKYLYVADIGAWKTYRYTINRDGSLTDKQLFAEQGSDGMTIDNRGNIYLTGNGVTVYNATGKKLVEIPIAAKWTANVCFGGKKRNRLFITASESLYVMDMLVHGIQ